MLSVVGIFFQIFKFALGPNMEPEIRFQIGTLSISALFQICISGSESSWNQLGPR